MVRTLIFMTRDDGYSNGNLTEDEMDRQGEVDQHEIQGILYPCFALGEIHKPSNIDFTPPPFGR